MSALDALLLVTPESVCADIEAGRRAAERATDAVETRLRRRLVVRPNAQRLTTGARWWSVTTAWEAGDWARQWPVVLLTSDRPTGPAPLEAAPVEAEGALYAVDVPDVDWHRHCSDLGDETGERLGLTEWPDDGRAFYLAGYRRGDQTGEAGRAAVNAAIASAHPAWGPEALSAEAWARVPVLPAEVRRAAVELARGYLALDGTGLGALRQRRQDRGDASSAVTLDVDWEDRLLRPVDHLAWVDV